MGETTSEEPNNPEEPVPDGKCPEGQYMDFAGNCVDDEQCSDPNMYVGAYNQCTPCPKKEGDISGPITSDIWDTCRKCKDAQNGWSVNEVAVVEGYCLYCPESRVVCGKECCPEGYGCQQVGTYWAPVYECKPLSCQSNSDCSSGICDPLS